jgi:hypothetical protein
MSDDELRHGRRSRYPFVMVPLWAIFLKKSKGLSPTGFMVYTLLLAHVNSSREDGIAWPSQATLGDILDVHPDTIGRIINKELKPLGMVDVRVHRYGDNNSRRRNIYTVHEWPEEGFEGFVSLSDYSLSRGGSGANPQVTPDTAFLSGPETASASGPEATRKSWERDEATTKTLPPPPSSGATSRRDEDDEDRTSPLRGYSAQAQEPEPDGRDEEPVEVTSVDLLRAKALMAAIPWPVSKRMAMGATVRQRILSRMAELSAGGWNEDDVAEYISGRVPDWKAVRRPAELVATLLADSPTRLREAFQEAPEPREGDELAEARREHDRLAALLEQQKVMIADCSVCDEMGWYVPVGGGTMDWHGHGKMGLNTERNRAGRKVAQLEEARSTDDQQVWEFAKN